MNQILHELVPLNENSVNKLNKILSQFPIAFEVEQFINLYNMRLLNPEDDKVKELAKAISETYKNVSLHSKILIVKTKEEVAFDTSTELLSKWKMISSIKRLAVSVMSDGYEPETKLIFSDKNPGVLHLESIREKSDGETVVEISPYWNREKIFTKTQNLLENYLLANMIKIYDEEDEIFYIELSDIIDIDDSFIINIENIITSQTFKNS